MGRKAAPQPLSLAETTRPSEGTRPGETVPRSARLPPEAVSPRSPRSPFRPGQNKIDISSIGEPQPIAGVLQQPRDPLEQQQEQKRQQGQQQQQQQQQQNRPDQPRASPQPSPREQQSWDQQRQQQQQQQQPQPQQQQQPGHRHLRRGEDKASKSGFFFNFGKGTSKPSDRPIAHQHSNSRAEAMSRDSDRPGLSKQATKHSDPSQQDLSVHKSNSPVPSRSEISLASTVDYDSQGNPTSSSKRSKPKPFNLLSRTRSTKEKDYKESPSPQEYIPPLAPAPVKLAESETPYGPGNAPRTAPLQSRDRSFRDMMSSAVRNHSAERSQARDGGGRPVGRGAQQGEQSMFPPTPGGAFFSNLKHSRAAGIISNRLFGGGSRHELPVVREPTVDDEHYVLKVINMPLVEQTRLTRISKRLEDSRDKTEFWMPAFPWRAIDYLNYKGSEVEGLYRVPGSGPQIKRWQRKFDEELDVDLFEEEDLYDINIVGSMLKAWLRELPDDIFPKDAQERVVRECAGAEKVPPLLIEELSNLPPFKYYLLFAITCHLSLLLAHSDKNKMDFRNLCICFQPCMRIDSFCFKFLVCDWRDCWKGCKNEAKYIEEEYARFDQPPPKVSGNEIKRSASTNEETKAEVRTVSSSDSGKSPNQGATEPKARIKKKPVPGSTPTSAPASTPPATSSAPASAPEPEKADTNSTVSTTLTVASEQETPPRKSGDLRPLSPIMPLSPLNF